jgi:hypothetical protein
LRARHRIPVEPVRKAILWVIPEIRQPRRKLKKLADAVRQMSENGDGIAERLQKLTVDRWKKLIQEVAPEELDGALTILYYYLFNIEPRAPQVASALNRDVPLLEERLVLLLVLHLAGRSRTTPSGFPAQRGHG